MPLEPVFVKMNIDNKNLINPDCDADKPNKQSVREILLTFFGEGLGQIIAFLLFGTATGLYFVIGVWILVGLIPIGFLVFYFLKSK